MEMEMEKKERWGDEDDVSLPLLLLHKQRGGGGGCLIQEILVRLPVVSLLRFKAVCKFWRDLIQSPSFIHLHTTLNSSEFGSFIVQVLDRIFPPPPISSSSSSSLLMISSQSDSKSSVSISGGSGESGGSNDHDQEEEEGPVVDDLGFDMDKKAIVGSCNGLVCLRDTNFGSRPDQVYLWNPATGQFMVLPESIPIPGRTFDLVVFGFDVQTKDYKVVQFTGLKRRRSNGNRPEFCFCRVQVYSSSTHSWRLLKGISCLPGYPFDYSDNILYLNGACFFLAHFFYTKRYPCLVTNNRFIISFDFTKEILTPIQLPDHHRDHEFCLCSLGDQIALFISPNPRDLFEDDAPIRNCEDFNIWVLNYESSSVVNKESWTKLHSFQIQVKSPDEWYMPSGISNDGMFALLASEYDKKMNLYNFATKEVKRAFLSCGKVKIKAHAYKPSLVSVSFNQEQQQPIG